MSVSELVSVPGLLTEEKVYIQDNFSILEDKDLLFEVRELKKLGLKPAEILKRYRLRAGSSKL